MKLTLKEFEAQLALGKNLEGEARKAFYAALKSAQVVEVDAEGKETPVEVTIVDSEPEVVEVPVALAPVIEPTKAAEIAQIVKRVIADIPSKASRNPLGATGGENNARAIPATAKRMSHLKSGMTEEKAHAFGMLALAMRGFGNAKSWCDRAGIKLHMEGDNSLGGALVPEEFGTEIIRLVETYGVARRVLKMRQMNSDVRSDPRRLSGLTGYWVGEGEVITESTMTWDRVLLVAKKLAVITRMTSELNEDSAINLGDELALEIAYEFSRKEDQAAFLGDGTSTYGGIQGIASKLIAVNGVDDGAGIVLASGNTLAEFVLTDYEAVVGRLPQYAVTPNTRWVTSRGVYYSTMTRLELASGGVTATEVREGNRTPQFLGFPVEFSQVMPVANSNSQIVSLFGDFSLAGTFGDRRQITIKFSDDATVGGQSTFERDEIAVKGTERIDINIHDVGTATEAGPVIGLISAAA